MTERKIVAIALMPETGHHYREQTIVCDDGTAWVRFCDSDGWDTWEQIVPPSLPPDGAPRGSST